MTRALLRGGAFKADLPGLADAAFLHLGNRGPGMPRAIRARRVPSPNDPLAMLDLLPSGESPAFYAAGICPTCPLTCAAGSAGTCGPVP